MKYTLKSSQIMTPRGFIDGYLIIEDGKIARLSSLCNEPFESVKDLGNHKILPGIIDIHNHGYGGWSMTDPATINDVKGYLKALTSIGVTGILPTAREEAFEAIADTMDLENDGARIFGIHSEGPFWARGGENSVDEHYPLPSIEETHRYLTKAKGKIVLMAIAPELPKAYDVISYLHDQHVLVSLCHTAAYAKDIYQALDEVGIDLVTHTGNGMRGIHHRDVGVLGAALLSEGLTYEIITDLNHICTDMLKIMFKLQPYEKFVLISDSNYMAGLPTGRYMRYGRAMNSHETGLIKDDHGRIMGSGKFVLFNMKQLVEKVGVNLVEVSKMASLNPAHFLKIDSFTGTLEVGKDADFMVINDEFECQLTYVKGKLVFDTETTKDFLNLEALSRRISD
ncbi:MAG: N-acetylglucosamine-6-phosphate deacetylase [Erysipelotrichaceae bacterium]|nr:MAG: N-acetylglucosamine-6-phosphate deacetylase [Erysipelotrichaceae bacterium]